MKRQGQVWIRIFPDKPITKKPAEVRMGKGKGAPEYWVAVVRPGTIMFEAGGIDIETAKEALSLAQQKLPMATKFSVRNDYIEEQSMKNSEIKALSVEEIKQKLVGEREVMQKLKFAHAISPIENPMKIQVTRKLIARLETALTAKTLEN